MKLVDWLHELLHKHLDRLKIDEAFPLISALADREPLSVEDLARLTGYSKLRVQKSLKFLDSEGLIEGDDSDGYVLKNAGYRVFRRQIAALRHEFGKE